MTSTNLNGSGHQPGSHDGGQFDLFAQRSDAETEPTTAERFDEFHAANPHVYLALVHLARRYFRATGERKQSVQRLVEIARWDEKIRSHGEDGFEINNSFRPFYARLIMLLEPDLDGVFELRVAPEPDAWIAAYQGPVAA